MTFEQLAARLAGGFTRAIDHEELVVALRDALDVTALGELDAIKTLPGMVPAAAENSAKSLASRKSTSLRERACIHASLHLLTSNKP